MSRIALPDFTQPDTEAWFQRKLSSLIDEMINDNDMPSGEKFGLALIKNSPLVYNNALFDDSWDYGNTSFCNTSAPNIGPFVPKMEWKLDNSNASYTIDEMNGKCSWNISGIEVDIPDCSIKYLDPTSRYDSSDVIGAQGIMCPTALYSPTENQTSKQHIVSHNVYPLRHIKEARSSVSEVARLNNTFIFSEHSSATAGAYSGVFGSRFESSWEGIKVSFENIKNIFTLETQSKTSSTKT